MESEAMDGLKIAHAVVLLVCLAGGIYYTVSDNHVQGSVVVLLGILYFLGMRELTREE